ncbi:MAG: site-specific integrase [Myxococcota bacterium]|nr:site-specific integrase [Myxococcota bacterium]
MTAIAPHVSDFLRVRLPVERNASAHTRATYSHAFMLLFEFAARRLKCSPSGLKLEQLDAKLVMAFLDHLERERSNGISSRNARLAAIKSLFRYIEHRVPAALDQVRRILAIPTKRSTSRLVGYLTREEAQAIINAPDSTAVGLRDRAMLHLAVATGMRVSELVGTQLEDLDLHPQPVITVLGKGRRERRLPLWRETATALKRWLRVRPDGTSRHLFLNDRGGALTRSGFAYVLDKYVEVAANTVPSLGKKRVSPHVLRHTCAMLTLQATRDVRKVALWLGHAHLTTTEVYLRADPTEHLDALAKVAPFGLRPGRFKNADKLMAMLTEARTIAP